ncbi:MAG: hypothetical protein HC802_23020 [Caldilineaceae bacterium]|nr:hypothetical protein [Caldilineaceae bacterium]
MTEEFSNRLNWRVIDFATEPKEYECGSMCRPSSGYALLAESRKLPMPSNNVLEAHFSQLLQSLNAEAIPYLIIGGYAVIVHGYVRATKDLDIWIEPNERHAEALNRCLRAIGIQAPIIELMFHLRESSGLRIGGDDNRIDLLFRVAGVDFAPSYGRRIELEVDGVPLPFIGLADLRASKHAAGRLQDQLDLENLPLA